jgi:hypothetical protein
LAAARTADVDGSAISFTLTLEDHVVHMYFTRRRSFATRHSRFLTMTVVVLVLPPAIIALNPGTLAWPDAEDSIALAAVLFFAVGIEVALWYGDPWLDLRLYRMVLRGRDNPLGPAQIEAEPGGFHVADRSGRRVVPWRSIIAVETGRKRSTCSSPEPTQIMPRRAFASERAIEAFAAAIRQRRREHRAAAIPLAVDRG